MPTLNLNQNLNEQQRSSITGLLGSGRALNETDARNLAYATGQGNWQQFVGQSASNYSIGNLAQFAAPAQANTNPANGSNTTIPNQGQSTMGTYFNNQIVTGLSQFEQSIMNYANQQEVSRQERESQAQGQYDQAFAGLENAQNGESGEALMRRLMAEQGIQDKQNQLVEFQKQLANLQNQYTTANNAIGNQPINTAIIRGQQYLKQQEFAAKATLVQAQGAIVEGQLNFAQDLVKGYYEAASTDRLNQINRYQNLLSLADQKLVRLDAEEKDNLNMMIGTLQSAEKRQQDNKDKISELMLDPIMSIAWTSTPGLSLDMNYNDIVKQLMPAAIRERQRQMASKVSTASVTGDAKNSSDRVNIANDMQSILGADGYVDTAKYKQIRDNIAVTTPSLLNWFDDTYAPKTVLNPNDKTASRFLQTPTQLTTPEKTEPDLISVLSQYKNSGWSKKDLENIIKKKYGFIPEPAKNWIKSNY